MFSLFGNAQALPERWSCDRISVYKIKETFENAEHAIYTNEYYGEHQGFSLSIVLRGIKGHPYSVIQCGSAGCVGKMTNLKTKQSKNFRFDCSLEDNEGNALSCHMIRCEQINATGIDEEIEELVKEYGNDIRDYLE